MDLFALARTVVELAEAKMAVGDEGAHPELGGQSHGVAIVRLGRRHVETVIMQSNLAEKTKRPCLGAAVAAFIGKHQALSGHVRSILQPAGEHVRLAKMHEQRRPPLDMPH